MDSMDLGIPKFFEVFEVRFGRKLTTGLVALVGAGIAAVCVQLIVGVFILPIYSFTSSLVSHHTDVVTAIKSISISPFVNTVVSSIFILWLANNAIGDAYGFMKRRQIQRLAGAALVARMERLKIYGWILQNPSDAAAVLAHVESGEAGLDPKSDPFLAKFVTNHPEASPPALWAPAPRKRWWQWLRVNEWWS